MEDEYLIFEKGLWKITSTFTLPQLNPLKSQKALNILCFLDGH